MSMRKTFKMLMCSARTTHSLRNILFWMILVTGLSSLLTYHIGFILPWEEANPPKNYVEGQIRINTLLVKEVIFQKSDIGGQLKEVMFEKSDIGGQHNQHYYRKLSQASDPKSQSSQISNILAKLKQVEARIQRIAAYKTVLSLGTNRNQTQIIEKAFSQQNYTVSSEEEYKDTSGNWSVIWMQNVTSNPSRVYFQKVNQIPALHHVMEQSGYICHLQTVYNKITEEYNTSCHDSQSKVKFSLSTTFLVHRDKDRIQTVQTMDLETLSDQGTIWQTERNLLKQNGHIFHLQVIVFVASLFPLRIYVYAGDMLKKAKAVLTDQLGEQTESIWWANVKKAIVFSLLTTENLALRLKEEHLKVCWRCSQIVQFTMVFTSDLYPIITKVKLNPQMSLEVLEDIVMLMEPKEMVSMDIAVALGESSNSILLGKKECRRGFGTCLLESDIVYLLENAHESKSSNEFIKLYPSIEVDFTTIINRLQQIWMNERSLKSLNQDILLHGNHIPEFHTTTDVHSVLHQVESYISTNVDYTEENLLRSNLVPNSNFHRHLKSSDQKDYLSFEDHEDHLCSRDAEDIPLLSDLRIYPLVDLEFYSYQSVYNITIDYDMIVLRIQVTAKGCLTEARFDNISGLVSQSNYTIGLGYNTIKIHVVDYRNRQPVIINTYTLNINRKYFGLEDSQTSSSVLKTCVLKQECSLKFLPGESCGLQPSGQYVTWNQFIAESNRKPYCNNYQDSIDCDWKVPCRSCDDRNSCYWKQARWQPSFCQHRQLSSVQAKKCFKGKKILFIGDSTNRGIMHYILEKINGTLSDWDKTHDLKLYTGMNDGQTTMSFAYYPQFWLPNNHRPGFDKAVYQLIKWTSPLHNNSNTVLVVGGVHWLGKQHINVILNALRREGLTGIRLIMKGHGAGFHQYVEGVHYASLDHQQKLELQEREVSRFAAGHGFHVVPTFNMTMSRYKDFLQGKCACHFHKVSMKTDRQGQKRYHIEGEINAAYSELVIDQICRHKPG